jgi:hypothetical protein
MDQFSGSSNDQQGSEDPSEAREHVRHAEENRDALEAQARRTEATAPDSVDQPVHGLDASQGSGSGGMSTSGGTRASEDASAAQSHVEQAERNRDALEAQNRRVESTTPDEVRDDR